jgi:hypothetical protein
MAVFSRKVEDVEDYADVAGAVGGICERVIVAAQDAATAM